MSKTIKIIYATIIFAIIAQSQMFYVSNKPISYPEIARRAKISASFIVNLKIDEFKPRVIQISATDSLSNLYIDLFRQAIEDNLNTIIYLKDTAYFNLKVSFIIKHYTLLSSNYTEVLDNEIRFVSRSPLIKIDVDYAYTPPNPKIDTVLINATIPYKSGKTRPSNILVQRIFIKNIDSVRIIKNNYPEIENDILLKAKTYTKEYFLGKGSRARYYFIRYRVVREISEYNIEQIF